MNINEAELFKIAEGIIFFFCKDEFIVMFRKLLKSEQHKFPLAANLLKQYDIGAPILFQTQIFESFF